MRKRIATSVSVLTLSALLLCSCGGSRQSAPRTHQATTSKTTETTYASATVPNVAMCDASDLRAAVASAGEDLSAIGLIGFTNTSASACSLQGYLGISIPTESRNLTRIEVVDQGLVGPSGFQANDGSGHPEVVVLQPGHLDAAWIGSKWSNWCGQAHADMTLTLVLPDGQQLPVSTVGLWKTTNCADSSSAWVLDEGPVQTPIS